MDRYKAQAREVLDRWREQLLARLPPVDNQYGTPGMEKSDLLDLSPAMAAYVEAEAAWHDIRDEPDEDEEE